MVVHLSSGPGFDPDVLREKYRAERDRRIRPGGLGQYQPADGRFGFFADDPYTERVAREPLDDRVEVVVVNATVRRLAATLSRPAGSARRRPVVPTTRDPSTV